MIVLEKQFSFIPTRLMTKTIHLLIWLIEKYKKNIKDIEMVLIKLNNAYDNISREKIRGPWKLPVHDMYCWSTTCF